MFGVEDDLLTMPHSVLVKIQFGGLLGLQREMQTQRHDQTKVDNIHALVESAKERYQGIEAVPCEHFGADITAYKVRRRRG